MIAIPAVDLREGACVQLVGGAYEQERVRLKDPLAVARQWLTAGFARLHLVDLDAALERGSNAGVIERILRGTRGCVQVGGGVRSGDDIARLLDWGAANVIVGTRALTDAAWIEAQASRHPQRLIVAADVRGGRLTTRGWTREITDDLPSAIRRLTALPLAGILATAVDVEGRLLGPALDLIERIVGESAVPVFASGGIASEEDLRELESRGAAGAVIGMALYTGMLDARSVAREFAA